VATLAAVRPWGAQAQDKDAKSADKPAEAPASISFNPGEDMPYVSYLPSYAATAWYHKVLKDRPDNLPAFLEEARHFAQTGDPDALEKPSTLTFAKTRSSDRTRCTTPARTKPATIGTGNIAAASIWPRPSTPRSTPWSIWAFRKRCRKIFISNITMQVIGCNLRDEDLAKLKTNIAKRHRGCLEIAHAQGDLRVPACESVAELLRANKPGGSAPDPTSRRGNAQGQAA
jgi:hypothetical protein